MVLLELIEIKRNLKKKEKYASQSMSNIPKELLSVSRLKKEGLFLAFVTLVSPTGKYSGILNL